MIVDTVFLKNIQESKPEKILNNFQNKLDKKNKNINKLNEDLENRKNKVKQKKKNRSKIHIADNDILMDNTEIISGNNSDAFNLALMRPVKINKNKKQLRKNTNDYTKSKQIKKDKNFKDIANGNKNKDDQVLFNKEIVLDGPLTIKQLSDKLSIPEASIITWLFLQGISVTINQVIDISIAMKVANHYSFSVLKASNDYEVNNSLYNIKNNNILNGIQRPPIITIFGHVDHGKTSLINSIRKANSLSLEAGGITQAITAYEVNWEYLSSIYKLVFLDTPGHEAFMGMRSRGAEVTDVAILLIAADDGLKPQGIEAIKHIMSLKIPYIVAINKIDKDSVDVAKVKQQLADYNIIDKDWGGDSIIIEISALKNINIDNLLSSICKLSLSQGFKANPNSSAEGSIIEGYIDKKIGPIAIVLVKNGTLKVGDIIVAGSMYGKVKLIVNNNKVKVSEAGPSSIIQVLGFSSVPQAGLNFYCLNNEKYAKQLVSDKLDNSHNFLKSLNTRVTFENMSNNSKQVNVILKTDTQGSIEAIIHSFSQISQEKVQINLISFGQGSISDKDLDLAVTSNSIILGFNIIASHYINTNADKQNINVQIFNVIYDLLDYIKQYMISLVDPEYDKALIGNATVQTVFNINKGIVAGCIVNSGKLRKNSYIQVYSNNILVYDGVLTSLKRLKDDVDEVKAVNECGVMCLDYNLWRSFDRIEAYELIEKKKVL
uniref:Translation initiation factor IF-2, chloroplastic n=1 Tax=Leiomenia cribrosa TaxID=217483 RepID=A0A4D6WY37_9FLOR|nr:Translation initiation factor 2 [Leiomenia cribrosa]